MSERTANIVTLVAVVVGYGGVAVLFWWMAWTIARVTLVRTALGSWLVRLKAGIGVLMAVSAVLWLRGLGLTLRWWEDAEWQRWALRAAIVLAVAAIVPAAVGVVHALAADEAPGPAPTDPNVLYDRRKGERRRGWEARRVRELESENARLRWELDQRDRLPT